MALAISPTASLLLGRLTSMTMAMSRYLRMSACTPHQSPANVSSSLQMAACYLVCYSINLLTFDADEVCYAQAYLSISYSS